MKLLLKIIIPFALLLALMLPLAIPLQAKESPLKSVYESKAKAIYLYSYEAKSVLYSKGEDVILPPASTVKIMTGLIACEKLSNRLEEKITVSPEMLAGHNGTSMGLEEGMTVTVRDLLYGTVCGANNDAAQAIAIVCAGTVNAFVEEMNAYASALKMNDTIYKNPTGLDENGAQTTATDVAIISKKAIQNELYKKISSATSYEYTSENRAEIKIYNRNALISNFSAVNYLNDSASGLIGGSTDNAGYVLSTFFQNSGSSYLCIVMGAQADEEKIYSYEIANEIFEKALTAYSYTRVLSAGEVISELPIENALTTKSNLKIPCITESDIFAYIPNGTDAKKDLKYKPFFHDEALKAPITKGDVIGGINVYLDGKFLGTTRIVASESVAESEFLRFMNEAKHFLVSRYFLIFLAVLLPALALFLYFERMGKRRRKARFNRKKSLF